MGAQSPLPDRDVGKAGTAAAGHNRNAGAVAAAADSTAGSNDARTPASSILKTSEHGSNRSLPNDHSES